MSRDAISLRAGFQRLVRQVGLADSEITPCGVGIPPVRAHALMYLWETRSRRLSPMQRELQDVLGIHKSNVSRLVRLLAADGYVVETVCPADARARRVELTAAGRRIARELDRKSLQTFSRILDAFPEPERAVVTCVLHRVADELENVTRPLEVT